MAEKLHMNRSFVPYRSAVAELFLCSGKEHWKKLEKLLAFVPKRDAFRSFEISAGFEVTSVAFEDGLDKSIYRLINNTLLLFERSDTAAVTHDDAMVMAPEEDVQEYVGGLDARLHKQAKELFEAQYPTFGKLRDLFVKGIREDRETHKRTAVSDVHKSSFVLLLALIKRLTPSVKLGHQYPGIGLLRYRFLQLALIKAIEKAEMNPRVPWEAMLIAKLSIALNPLLFIPSATDRKWYYGLNGIDEMVLTAYERLKFDRRFLRSELEEALNSRIEGAPRNAQFNTLGPVVHALDLEAMRHVQRALRHIHDARIGEFESMIAEEENASARQVFSRFKLRWFRLASEEQVLRIYEQGGIYYFSVDDPSRDNRPFWVERDQREAAVVVDQKGYAELMRRASDRWGAGLRTWNGMQNPITRQFRAIQQLAQQHFAMLGETDFVNQQGDSFAAVGDIIPMLMHAIGSYELFDGYREMLESSLFMNVESESVRSEARRRNKLEGGVAIAYEQRSIRLEGEPMYQCGREITPVDFMGNGINLASRLCTRDHTVQKMVAEELEFATAMGDRTIPWNVLIKDGALYNVGIALDQAARDELLVHERILKVGKYAQSGLSLTKTFPITSLHDDILERFAFLEDEIALTMVRFLGIPGAKEQIIFRGLLRYAGEARLKSFEDSPIHVHEFIPESRVPDTFYALFMKHHGNAWSTELDQSHVKPK